MVRWGIRGGVLGLFAVVSTAAVAAPSGLNDACTKMYKKYEAKAGPKAFATSTSGYCGWAWRKKSTDAEFEAAKVKAVGFCMSAAGTDCQVVEAER